LGQRNVESMKLAEANSLETTVKLIKLCSSGKYKALNIITILNIVRMRTNLMLRLELETTLAMTKPWSQRTST
jgi:hypothetical protein